MKICVLGLDCAAPEIVFSDERLKNIRRLMNRGLWGRLESVIPPITVPAWMCMCTSQDPGSLGVYGFRNRNDYSYAGLRYADSRSVQALAIWDYLALQGKKAIVFAVPPNYPPRRLHGISLGCFLTPNTQKNEFTYPSEIKKKIIELVGDYPPDVAGFRTDDKASKEPSFRDEPQAVESRALAAGRTGMGLFPLCRYRAGPNTPRLLEFF